MEIKIGKSNETLLVQVSGQLMEPEQEFFKKMIDEVSKNTAEPKVVFDISFLLNMSSSGLGKLIVLHKRWLNRAGDLPFMESMKTCFLFFKVFTLKK